MNTRDLAAKRREEWLKKHGVHKWEERNLWKEAQEEQADSCNYLIEEGQDDLASLCCWLGDEIARRAALMVKAGQLP